MEVSGNIAQRDNVSIDVAPLYKNDNTFVLEAKELAKSRLLDRDGVVNKNRVDFIFCDDVSDAHTDTKKNESRNFEKTHTAVDNTGENFEKGEKGNVKTSNRTNRGEGGSKLKVKTKANFHNKRGWSGNNNEEKYGITKNEKKELNELIVSCEREYKRVERESIEDITYSIGNNAEFKSDVFIEELKKALDTSSVEKIKNQTNKILTQLVIADRRQEFLRCLEILSPYMYVQEMQAQTMPYMLIKDPIFLIGTLSVVGDDRRGVLDTLTHKFAINSYREDNNKVVVNFLNDFASDCDLLNFFSNAFISKNRNLIMEALKIDRFKHFLNNNMLVFAEMVECMPNKLETLNALKGIKLKGEVRVNNNDSNIDLSEESNSCKVIKKRRIVK